MPSKAELSEFLDPNLAVGDIKRYSFCPYCNKPVQRDGFISWRTDSGWRHYCHRCGTSRRIRQDGVAAPSALISRVNGIRSYGKTQGKQVYLPEDFELLVPSCAKIWLRKYGVTDDEIKRYRFGYSERMNRLILPVFNGEELVYWQGRSLAPSKYAPKYLSMKTNSGSQFFNLCAKGAKEVVLVEDIISAIVLRRAGYNAIALLGSYIGDKAISFLHKLKVKRVCVWLDPDKRKDAVAFAKRLNGLGFKAACLVTPTKDPKDYNVTQVRSHLVRGGFTYGLEAQEGSAR